MANSTEQKCVSQCTQVQIKLDSIQICFYTNR